MQEKKEDLVEGKCSPGGDGPIGFLYRRKKGGGGGITVGLEKGTHQKEISPLL